MDKYAEAASFLTGRLADMQEQVTALTERNRELRGALREGLNLQSRWPLDKKIYPDEAAWIAKVRRLIEEK